MTEEFKNPLRAWQSGNTLDITGRNVITGEELKYTFTEMNQEYGSEILHKYVLILVHQWDKAQSAIRDIANGVKEAQRKKELNEQMTTLASLLPELLSWEQVKELARLLLAERTLKIDDVTYTSGESGFIDYNDPLEIYHAIFYAMLANWPKYISPLLAALLGDSTPDSEADQN